MGPPREGGFLRRLEALDLHPKLVTDFEVRTKTGAGSA
jgi:hypothetical protein